MIKNDLSTDLMLKVRISVTGDVRRQKWPVSRNDNKSGLCVIMCAGWDYSTLGPYNFRGRRWASDAKGVVCRSHCRRKSAKGLQVKLTRDGFFGSIVLVPQTLCLFMTN